MNFLQKKEKEITNSEGDRVVWCVCFSLVRSHCSLEYLSSRSHRRVLIFKILLHARTSIIIISSSSSTGVTDIHPAAAAVVRGSENHADVYKKVGRHLVPFMFRSIGYRVLVPSTRNGSSLVPKKGFLFFVSLFPFLFVVFYYWSRSDCSHLPCHGCKIRTV